MKRLIKALALLLIGAVAGFCGGAYASLHYLKTDHPDQLRQIGARIRTQEAAKRFLGR